MKAVILAGGLGTRISEETATRPKPMIEIGGKPILWHIMKTYASFGITHFVIAVGYKGYVIKEFFYNYSLHTSDVTFDLERGGLTVHGRTTEPWQVTLVDTGDQTMTGGRLKRLRPYVDDGTFCMTYGDGLADVDIGALSAFHVRQGRKATMTVVQPPGRFGAVVLEGDRVSQFYEKPRGDGGWVNGGFFILEPAALDVIDGDATPWEAEPLERLAAADHLAAYYHYGFWHPLDTLRDKSYLEGLWTAGNAPWKTWA